MANKHEDKDKLENIKQDQIHDCDQYTELKRIFRDIGRMSAIAEILGRDFLTAMPDGAYSSRLNQIAYLHRLIQEQIIEPRVLDLLHKAQEHKDFKPDLWDPWDSANLREMINTYQDHCLIHQDLMEKSSKLETEGRKKHTKARETGDWEGIKEHLKHAVKSKREIAELKMKATDAESLYEALLQDYCPGIKVKVLEEWFSRIDNSLKELLPQILEKQSKETKPIELIDFYPDNSQMWLNEELLALFGFDFERGGLYQTGHNPVEGGTPDDTRLVISCADTSNFLTSLKSTLHEGGHGLYIQGLPRKTWRYQPVATDLGAAVHESQALLVEMIMARSEEFFDFLSPRLEGLFHTIKDPSLSAKNLNKIKNWVKPQFDRKKSDEVTYFYHVLLRYRIEKDLIEGKIEVDDIPERWNNDMYDLLGIKPSNNSEGCLQDVHWFVGKFGYYPAYTIGHMMATQLYDKMKDDIPNIRGLIYQGEFAEITDWMYKNIHSKGRLLKSEDLIKEITGKYLDEESLLNHIKRRYL